MIYIPEYIGKVIESGFIVANWESIILVKLKTTKKHLPENPRGFIFGATEKEFKLGELLGDKFRFCFVFPKRETTILYPGYSCRA